MGYSNSPKAILRMNIYLDRLVTATDSVVWKTTNPRALAYGIRQALTTCHKFPNDFPKYLPLRIRWKIKETGGYVIAEPRPVIETIEVGPEILQARPDKLVIENANQLMQVLGAVLKSPKDLDLYFPNANLLPSEIERLEKWAKIENREMTYHEGAGLTIHALSPLSSEPEQKQLPLEVSLISSTP